MSANLDGMVVCPVHEIRNDSKTAPMAAENVVPEPQSRLVQRFAQLREILRNRSMRQGGAQDAPTEKKDPTKASIFFLFGEAHQRRRAAILPFFTPDAIATRHMAVMERTTSALIAEFRSTGRGRLDKLSFELAVAVAAEIIGMTNSKLKRMAARITAANGAPMAARGGVWKHIAPLKVSFYVLQVFYFDVKPAIAARRRQPKEDVISRLLDEGRSDQEILVECLTFGLAGMTTTREFIVVAAWHLFDSDELRQRFLDGDDSEKTAILMEILRLEPVASMIYRSAAEDMTGASIEPIAAGTRLSLCIRAANLDETEVGPCPTMLDPDRAKRLKVPGDYMSFGAGAHRCPGWLVALTETRVFLDQLLRVPGIRLVRPPDIEWVPPMLMSYELRNAVIACDRG